MTNRGVQGESFVLESLVECPTMHPPLLAGVKMTTRFNGIREGARKMTNTLESNIKWRCISKSASAVTRIRAVARDARQNVTIAELASAKRLWKSNSDSMYIVLSWLQSIKLLRNHRCQSRMASRVGTTCEPNATPSEYGRWLPQPLSVIDYFGNIPNLVRSMWQ